MSPSPSQWMEIAFNVSYLVVIYALVAMMSARLAEAEASQRELLRRFRDGFLLLAIGDTGHVGFRAIALLRGDLDMPLQLGRLSLPLVGVGALMTAITVTFLYLLLLDAWRIRFAQPRRALYGVLVALGVVRLLLLVPPQNDWGAALPPFAWSLARNAPLAVLGVTVGVLMLRDGGRAHDATFRWLGALILVSYAFYAPVILLVQRWPAVGLLMVPKTLAYLGMAFLLSARLFKRHGGSDPSPPGRLLPH